MIDSTNSRPPRKRISRSALTAMVASAVVLLGVAGLGVFFVFRSMGAGIGTIAVLPLRNAGDDSSIDSLSDGLTESIISELSRFHELKVVSWNPEYRFSGKGLEPQEAGIPPGVQAVLAGEVTRAQGVLTVRVELRTARGNTQIWSDVFRMNDTGFAALKKAMSDEIVHNLRPHLGAVAAQ